MGWSSYQKDRINFENELLRNRGFTNFRFYNLNDKENCYLKGTIYSNSYRAYELKIKIPDFPYRCPQIEISDPILYTYTGTNLATIGSSHAMHTLSSFDGIHTHPCLYRSERWESDISIIDMIIKCLIWIEAYEAHKQTGRDIASFVNTMN